MWDGKKMTKKKRKNTTTTSIKINVIRIEMKKKWNQVMGKCNDDDDDYQYIGKKSLLLLLLFCSIYNIKVYTMTNDLFVCWSWYNSIGEYSVCVCVGVCGERERIDQFKKKDKNF